MIVRPNNRIWTPESRLAHPSLNQMFGMRHMGVNVGGGAPRPMERVHTTLNTSTGTQDIKVSQSIGKGAAPIGVCIVACKATATGITDTVAGLSVGFFDGSNQLVHALQDENGVSTTNPQTRSATDEVLMVLDTDGSVLAEANATALIPNGVRINVSVNSAGAAYQVMAFLFFASGGSAAAGTYSPNTTQDGSVTVTPGFEANVILSVAARNGFDDTGRGDGSRIPFGFAVNGGGQVSAFIVSVEGKADGDIEARVVNNRGAVIDATTAIEYGSFTSTQFSATTRDSTAEAANVIGYLALRMPGVNFDCGILDTPTSVGNADETSTGNPMSGAMFIPTIMETENSVISNELAEAYGFAGANEDGLSCLMMALEDGVGTTDVESRVRTSQIESYGADSIDGAVAESFTELSNGFRMGFPNTVDTSAKKWPYLAFGK